MICRAIPYEGEEPYIFLSYCHKDAAVVYPLLEQMVKDGFRIWYDDGNHAGDDWLENIANHLNNCTACLAMISENSSVSHNCKSEISEALSWDKKLAAVMLEDFRMPLGMRLQLSTIHYLKKTDFPAKHMLLQKLYESSALAGCRGSAGSLPMKDIPDIQHDGEKEPQVDNSRISEYVKAEKNHSGTSGMNVVSGSGPEVKKEPAQTPPAEESGSQQKNLISRFKIKRIGKVRNGLEEAQEPPEERKNESENRYQEERGDEPDPEKRKIDQESLKSDTNDDQDSETVYDGETVLDGASDEDAPTVMDDGCESAVLVRMLTGQAYVLPSALARIGRSEKHCDILINDNEYLGGTHAEIIQYRNRYYLRDLNSANGTFINESRLSPEEHAELNDMTFFLLHKELFLFLHGDASRQIINGQPVCYLANTNSRGIRFISEEPLYLDRGHRWEDGTLGDEKISRSGKHALIRWEDGDLFLEDLGSRNGTYLNKSDIRGKGAQRLNEGDQIRLGDTVLKVGIISL